MALTTNQKPQPRTHNMRNHNFIFNDRETYLQQVSEWKKAYSYLSKWQKVRKNEIKAAQRDQVVERDDETSPKFTTLCERHSAIDCAVKDVRKEAQLLLNIRNVMRQEAKRQSEARAAQ